MSTLSGIAAKGEKGKSKFQSLDINNLYRASRGESLETHQHKNTSSRRHGMQTLGKVPSARRAPANLPSLKSEYSGNDPAISLVPSGGTGWGSKPGETGPPPTSTQVSTPITPTTPSVTSAPPATVAATVSTPSLPAPATSTTVAPATIPSQSHGDKSWSSITSSGTESTPMFLAHQSPYFQQEFPSLSGDANAASGSGPNKTDATHLPGPSLRPQTEGSWMQGGSRPPGPMAAGVGSQQATAPVQGPLPLPHHPQGSDVGGGRNNLGPSGVGVGPAGPLPPAGVPPHHYRLMPNFMMRHNHPSGGFPPNLQHGPQRPRFPYPPDARFMQPNRGPSNVEQEEVTSRPIIKEEDLRVMDDIARDTGWAAHDEIDYNQTLSFSDEDGAQDDESKAKNFRHAIQIIDKRETDNNISEKETESLDSEEKLNRENSRESMLSSQNENREPPRAWQPRPADFRQGVPPVMVNFPPQQGRVPNHQGGRQGEDDEIWRERRKHYNNNIAIAIEKAKQRKEEEEKRFIESRQAAARKLQQLDEKLRSETVVDKDENTGSPPLAVQHGSNALLPDWEKDKDKNRSRASSEDKDEKSANGDNFRNVQQVDSSRSGFVRDRERDRDRDLRPEREVFGQSFSRQFQNNLPPRFQKQAAERPVQYYRQGSGGSPQPPPSGQPPYDSKWSVGTHFGGSVGSTKSHRNRNDSDISERDRDESKDSNRDRDRNVETGFENRERDRFNRPPSRDNRERIHETNWKSTGYIEETSSRISGDSEHGHEFDNRQYEKCEESEEYSKEDKEYKFYEDNRDTEKKPTDSFKTVHAIQEDPFNERDFIRDSKIETDRRDLSQKSESRERPERPQRPDSRDSRTSRDSRNSKDSIREENKLVEENFHGSSLSWADSSFDMEHKEVKRRKDVREEREPRRDLHVMQSYHQRHIPGPITKEKLEASELKCESNRNMNLVPLVRTDKKPEVKKSDNQWDIGHTNSGDAWQRVSASPAPAAPASSECWADSTAPPAEPSSDMTQSEPTESQQARVDSEETNKTAVKTSHPERDAVETNHRPETQRDKMMGRGGNRGMRHDSRVGPRQGWGSSYFRGAPPAWRGNDRGRRSQHRRHNPARSGELGHSESEASGDEKSASTESGKEDKRQDQERKPASRSPKQGFKKSDKDDRLRDNNRRVEGDKDSYSMVGDMRGRYDKRVQYDGNRMGSSSGFEPRGEPSRRGRGSAPFRSKGSTTSVGRRMDGYGPPTSKRPFTSDSSINAHEDKKSESTQNQVVNKDDTLSEMSHDEKMKINQQQLSAGIIGNTSRLGNFKSQPPNIPPRLRRKSEGERRDRKSRDSSRRTPRDSVKCGSGSGGEVGDENWETTSETSEQEERDHECDDDRQSDPTRRNYSHNAGSSRGYARRHSQSNRGGGREKRGGGSFDRDGDHNSRRSLPNTGPQSMVNGNVRTQNNKYMGPAKEQVDPKANEQKQPRADKEKRNNLDRYDLSNTASVVVIDDQPEGTVEEDQTVFATDNNGFQEVRSKKNVKEANRQQKEEPAKDSKERAKLSKPPSSQSPGPPVNSAAAANKGTHERTRTGKLAPRFAKQREMTRLQKIAQQQHTHDVSELNKINQGVPVFPAKDLTSPAPPPPVNAWDKPITAALRTVTPPAAPNATVQITALAETCNIEVSEHAHSTTSSQRSSPSGEKSIGKMPKEPMEKAVLDGTSPPVQTIIFENTNLKSAPVDSAMKSKYTNQINKNQKPEKARERKLEDENVSLGFKSPGPDMKLQENKTDPIQMPISFNKNEDNADMKLDFRFDSDLSQLDDKTTKNMAAIQMTRSIQMVAQSSAAELQFKLASVKKVWENPPTVLEHGGEENSTVSTASSFTPTFGNSVEDPASYGKTGVTVVDPSVGDESSTLTPEVYNSSQQIQNNANTYNGSTVQTIIKPDPSSNVCKLLAPQVKPQPQAAMHPHSGPLSPPSGAFTSSPAQPSQHINYQIRDSKFEPKGWIHIRESDSQKTVYTYFSNCEEPWHKVQPPGADPQQFQQCRPNLTPPAQYSGISAIPSPPAVYTPQPELYPTFQINNPQVMGSQGRSQFSQYASPYLSQGLGQTSGFSQQSMYLHQTAPPPPSAAPPDMFQAPLSQYRIQPPAFGASQQLSNNPNTVLISSSTNSLMSASVKPSPQPIGAIGSKAASYQAPSQPPPSQLYIYPDPQLLNHQTPYLQNSQLVQRPASNVVPTIPPSSASYYSPSTGGGATGFYQPGGSTMQAAAHQTTFSMQAFNTQSPAATPAGMGSFGSTFLSNGLQMAQQYRSTAPSYLKSAADHQDVLSVFSSPATQINSPKSRTNGGGSGGGGKQSATNGSSQQQPSPTQGHHKFATYQQNVSPTTQLMIQQQQQQQRGSMSVRVAPRYPTPIQRPVTFQPISRHRLPNRYKLPPTVTSATATSANHYYVSQNNTTKLDSADLETKVETTSSDCENSTAPATGKSTDITTDDSPPTND